MGGISIALLFSNLLGLFVLIGVGFAVARAGIVPESAIGPLTSLLLKVTLPCTIFSSMIRPFDPQFLRDSLVIIAIGLVIFPLLALLSRLLCRPFGVKEGTGGCGCSAAPSATTASWAFP